MSTDTPAEQDLPLIISVDDHVMEPKDLWQQQLPASVRDRGPSPWTQTSSTYRPQA